MSALTKTWSGTLTEDQRTAWRTYAHQHPQPNRWGKLTLTNGYTRFIQANFTRYRLGVELAFADAPSHPPLHPPTFTFTAVAHAVTVTIDLSFPEYGGGIKNLQLFAYGGPEVNPGVAFYNGPWRFIDTNRYNTSWQFDPWEIVYPWNLTQDKKVFIRMLAQMRDHGEISTDFQTSTIIQP